MYSGYIYNHIHVGTSYDDCIMQTCPQYASAAYDFYNKHLNHTFTIDFFSMSTLQICSIKLFFFSMFTLHTCSIQAMRREMTQLAVWVRGLGWVALQIRMVLFCTSARSKKEGTPNNRDHA